MTKEELEKFSEVFEIMETSCPENHDLEEPCKCKYTTCYTCWKYAIENELNKLEESNV